MIVDALRVLQGSRLRNRRHDAHRQGRREDCREIDERHRHAREIAEQLRRLRHRIARDLKTLRHDQKVEVRHDRQHDTRRRHGQGERKDASDDRPERRWRFPRRRRKIRAVLTLNVLVQLPMIVDEHEKSADSAGKRAEARASRRIVESHRQEKTREEHHREHAEDLLDNLRDRRRRHALPALQIAA